MGCCLEVSMRDGFANSVAAERRVGEQFNPEEKSRCRFAADGEIGDRQCNL